MGVEALSDLKQEIVFWVRMLHTLLIILYVCVWSMTHQQASYTLTQITVINSFYEGELLTNCNFQVLSKNVTYVAKTSLLCENTVIQFL